MNPQQEEVLQTVSDTGVHLIRLWFTDVTGKLKGLAIDSGQLEEAFTQGITFDGSAIEGMSRVYESDLVLVPDARTFQHLPGKSGRYSAARMFCDVFTPEGEASLVDPRGVLERTISRAAAQGLHVLVRPEIEFYLLEQPATIGNLVPVDSASYFDHVAWGDSNNFRSKVVGALEDMGIGVEFSHHEGGPGQNEVDLRATDALSAADSIMTARAVIAEVALQEGMVATFMPKPFIDQPGSGLHLHLGAYEGNQSAFFASSADHNLSPVARHFIAGLLEHARSSSAIISQHVNSYKRLWGGGEAPSYVCWGYNNRSALVRVPRWHVSQPENARVEYRAADAATNPYLALALLISAGMDGVARRLPLEAETEDDVWLLTDQERRAQGVPSLPISLSEALLLMEGSELVSKTVGEEVFDFVLRGGEQEWRSYRHQITGREYERFFGHV